MDLNNITVLPAVLVTIEFIIEGQSFISLNGGTQFKFTEAVSFTVYCDTQYEIDCYWNKLTEEGEESVCGWLKDKYGLSWQITPAMMRYFFLDADSENLKEQ